MASAPITGGRGAPGAWVEPRATWQVMLSGQDITAKFDPRLITMTLGLWRHEKADELNIDIHDMDGAVVLPPVGASLAVSLGWAQGTGVTPGLVAMGSFVVDDLTWEGPPDTLAIKGHSADFKDGFRTRTTRTWTNQTLGAIVATIAAENGVTARCHPDLSGTVVDTAEQSNQSDMEFMRNLGRRYDAAATVKGGALIFAPIGATTTATGATLPAITITRSICKSWKFTRNAREATYQGAEANWHDQAAAKRQLHQEGSTPRRRLKRIYPSAAAAQAATSAEHSRLKRAAAAFEVELAYGDARIAPGMAATVSGFKSEIDGTSWLIAHVEHTMGANGFGTTIEFEVAP